MRLALWLVGLFAAAAAVALFAGNNDGTVTLFWPPYRVDLALNLTLLLLVVLFAVVHSALRALSALLAMPAQARRWRQQRQERALHVSMLDAVAHLVGGRFLRARKAAQSVLAREAALQQSGVELEYGARMRAMAHLLAAEGAQALQDRSARQQHLDQALGQTDSRATQETREGLLLRAARWALEDRDPDSALQFLDQLPQGAARRTVALRLRLRAARQARRSAVALETARLLSKHGAFSETAARGILRGLALDLIAGAHDVTQLQQVWDRLEDSERALPDVAIAAAGAGVRLGMEGVRVRDWLLPLWESLSALQEEQRVGLVRVLEQSLGQDGDTADADWLARIEDAQRASPGDPLLQYLAGMACLRLRLWGKAQQWLRQSQPRLQHAALQRRAWLALGELAQQRNDTAAAVQAWQAAAKLPEP